jgi:hypothetical protein
MTPEREKELEQMAFETFSQEHPHEAAEMDFERFAAFCRKRSPGIRDGEIKEILQATERAV